MKDIKITTHTDGHGYFYAEIDGVPLIGDKGGYSKFRNRQLARDEAKRRIQILNLESDKT